jgi:hypothetical protein
MWDATLDSSYRSTSPPGAGIDARCPARPARTAALVTATRASPTEDGVIC